MKLSPPTVYIAGIGIISPLGSGTKETEQALRCNSTGIAPLQLFPLMQESPLPAGQVTGLQASSSLPRTHQLAAVAVEQAMSEYKQPPDAVIIGTTTGGILTTERLLRENEQNKSPYRYHGLTTVTEEVARQVQCPGPALTVSTACSSGALAIILALRMLRSGKAECVLAGGVDSLCRLTYFGFNSLQLVDHAGCRPLDISRQGMVVAEGGAMLLLTTNSPGKKAPVLLGGGISCDAHHPTAPHPEGRGALAAMQAALSDASLDPETVEYLSLHGTGTPDNDLVESKAVHKLFPTPPLLSSIKGATGHSLAASGAIEAAVSAIAICGNLIPANTGCSEPDPALNLNPVLHPLEQSVSVVLSNSFGFGGNNGCLLLSRQSPSPQPSPQPPRQDLLAIHGHSCLTGAGDLPSTLASIFKGESVSGMADSDVLSKDLPARMVRRLKRLSRIALSLAAAAHQSSGLPCQPSSVFMGTGWGALSETFDFLDRLTASEEKFPSPTDFIGSVHNGPAGQIAIMLGATGANITTSGGNCSFEQALMAAGLQINECDHSALIVGADEGHHKLSQLLDPSISPSEPLADGGGALVVSTQLAKARCCTRTPFLTNSRKAEAINAFFAWYKGQRLLNRECGLILVGIPANAREAGEAQLIHITREFDLTLPVIRYRPFTGEFASASAVAAATAVALLEKGIIPKALVKGNDIAVHQKNILVLGLGDTLSAMEFARL